MLRELTRICPGWKIPYEFHYGMTRCTGTNILRRAWLLLYMWVIHSLGLTQLMGMSDWFTLFPKPLRELIQKPAWACKLSIMETVQALRKNTGKGNEACFIGIMLHVVKWEAGSWTKYFCWLVQMVSFSSFFAVDTFLCFKDTSSPFWMDWH